MNSIWNYIADPSHNFLYETTTYLQICAFTIVIAIVIGVGLGVVVSRSAILGFIAINLSGLMRAIPIIAFLIAVLPYLGLGFTPAAVALIILGIPPILLNTYTGLRSIDAAMIDAARGMGMTTWQIIRRVQAPLVMPIIAAGIRTSAIQIIATATLAAFIGADGYGVYIVDGLYKLDNTEILAGAIPVAIIALIVEGFMEILQRVLTPAGLRESSGTPQSQVS
ncbi:MULTISPECIES: ABC transporter permease [Ktedonobacter]|uniref:Carnitine transport permease OpuCB n=1 Tax=Ktedonobacter robiniae TaxID=2778365 RepID=A0ABQ3UIA0_9CHLR|nr:MULTISPECIES: ABC transporter permease [Ktedonobacter]GHO52429.1 carnitine transport permease OpuCB [Ktedonobacter robiniae]GHO65996.1 carnitine transport permease OpuCB [Ktedonobacter sp. SOSP1-52]